MSASGTGSGAVAPTVAARFEQALACHQAGRLAEAERLYHAVLAQAPDHPDTLHLLGILCGQRNESAAGLALIERAVALRPRRADFLANLGNLSLADRQPTKAVDAWQSALALKPDLAGVWSNLGGVLCDLGRLEDAAEALARAIGLAPELADAHYHLGLVEERRCRPAEARTSYQRALALRVDHPQACFRLGLLLRAVGETAAAVPLFEKTTGAAPADADAWFELGTARLELGQYKDAEQALRAGLSCRPDHADTLVNLGNLRRRGRLSAEGDFDHARALYRQALAVDPGHPEANLNLGTLLREEGFYEEALAACTAALSRLGDQPLALYNLANAQRDGGRLTDAIATYKKVLALRPDLAEAEWNLSLALLMAGQYDAGWTHHESRWRRPEVTRPRFSFPTWDGRPAPAARLLLWAEQGFGDTIQFLRLVPAVAARVGRVVLMVQAPLKTLAHASLAGDTRDDMPSGTLAGTQAGTPAGTRPRTGAETRAETRAGMAAGADTPPGITVIGAGEPIPACDFEISLISAARAIGLRRDDPCGRPPYLAPPPALAAAWRQRIATAAAGRRAVGLVWGGSPYNSNDRLRSLPSTALAGLLAPLFTVAGLRWFSLQVGPRAAERAELGGDGAAAPIDLAPDLTDFATTAAALAALDLVVTVDTAVAHLTGALGRPGLVMLSTVPDWRWLLTGEDSPWYPTLRLFRQPGPGAWQPVVAAVAAALAGR